MLLFRRLPLLLCFAGLGVSGMVVLCAGCGGKSAARSPSDGTGHRSAIAHHLLHALADVDYKAFLEPAGGNFKKLPEDAFLRLVLQHGERLRGGYELQPIATTVRRDIEMTRWKVVFAGGGRDATLTLGMSGGTVRLFTLW